MTEQAKSTDVTLVKLSRNKMFRSITDGLCSEPERGFPPSITDTSAFESVQSIEARCMRGEIMLQKTPYYEYDGDVNDADLDVEDPEFDELTHFDDLADQLFDDYQRNQELPTGNEPVSDNSEKSEQATLPVDNSVIASGD